MGIISYGPLIVTAGRNKTHPFQYPDPDLMRWVVPLTFQSFSEAPGQGSFFDAFNATKLSYPVSNDADNTVNVA